MLLNPNDMIEKGIITFPEWVPESDYQKYIQPNAIDITLDYVYRFNSMSTFTLSETKKEMRELFFVSSIIRDGEYYFPITGNMDALSDFKIDLPDGISAELIIRSTLNRNEIFITSGLCDSGFSGNIGCVIRNQGPTAYIAPKTRIGQIKFMKSDSCKLYDGSYNNLEGHYTSEQQKEPIEVKSTKPKKGAQK